MKIVRRDFVPDGPGSVKMVAEEADDLWTAYNLIAQGDTVLAVTVRKVIREAASGGRDAERVKLKLEIKVETVEYDKEGCALRIRGKNILENEHVKIGAFHTLEIELHRPFVLRKAIQIIMNKTTKANTSRPSRLPNFHLDTLSKGLTYLRWSGTRWHLRFFAKLLPLTRSQAKLVHDAHLLWRDEHPMSCGYPAGESPRRLSSGGKYSLELVVLGTHGTGHVVPREEPSRQALMM